MAIKVTSAKAKGRKLQQWLRDQILSRWSSLTDDDVRVTPSGANGEDVQLSSAARTLLNVQLECKARASIAVYDWYEQAKTHGTHQPVLVIKGDYKKPLAVVDAEWLLDLMRSNKE